MSETSSATSLGSRGTHIDALTERGWALLGLAMFAFVWSWFLLVRNVSITVPLVIGDEYFYRSQANPRFDQEDVARTLQLPLPRTIYLALMRVATVDQGNGYVVAKAVNTFVFCLTLIPLCAIARRVLPSSWKAAAFVASGSLMLPFNQYTSYFMPEALYGFLFWVTVSIFIGSARGKRAWLFALLAGVCCAFHFMVKPHGVLLLGAMSLSIIFTSLARFTWPSVLRGMTTLAFLVAGFLPTVFLLLWIVSGHAQVDIGLYRAVLPQLRPSGLAAWRFSELSSTMLQHFSVVTCVFGALVPALFIEAARRLQSRKTREEPDHRTLFVVLISAYLLLQVFFVSQFTVQHAEMGRIHLRYYDFSFPVFLFILVVVGAAEWPKPLRLLCSVIGAGAVLHFWLVTAPHPSDLLISACVADAPELAILQAGPALKWAMALAGLVACAAFSLGRRWRVAVGAVSVGFILVCALFLSFVRTQSLNRKSQRPRAAGEWLQRAVPLHSHSVGVSIGPQIFSLYASQFFFTGAPAVCVLQDASTVDLERLARTYRWAHLMPESHYSVLNTAFYPAILSNGGTLYDLTGADLLGASSPECRVLWQGGFPDTLVSRRRNNHGCGGSGTIEIVSARASPLYVRVAMLVKPVLAAPIAVELSIGGRTESILVAAEGTAVMRDLTLHSGSNRIELRARPQAAPVEAKGVGSSFTISDFHVTEILDGSKFKVQGSKLGSNESPSSSNFEP